MGVGGDRREEGWGWGWGLVVGAALGEGGGVGGSAPPTVGANLSRSGRRPGQGAIGGPACLPARPTVVYF